MRRFVDRGLTSFYTSCRPRPLARPEEMTALCETWQPYRSLASVIMWGLVDA